MDLQYFFPRVRQYTKGSDQDFVNKFIEENKEFQDERKIYNIPRMCSELLDVIQLYHSYYYSRSIEPCNFIDLDLEHEGFLEYFVDYRSALANIMTGRNFGDWIEKAALASYEMILDLVNNEADMLEVYLNEHKAKILRYVKERGYEVV